jgi:5-(carboxyamino)imidazole ribonucleotide synthase
MATDMMGIGATVGILGGGQLGRMMSMAARAMGIRTVIWDPAPSSPAFVVADGSLALPYDSAEALGTFLSQVDRVTYEFENIDWELAQRIAEDKPVFPHPHILRTSQERVREKDTARQWGLSTTPYRRVGSVSEVVQAVRELGSPGVLKTATGGYDGKGQVVIREVSEAAQAFAALAGAGPYIYEKWVHFVREVSVVVARDVQGTIVTYPVTENYHHHGILDYSIVPARISAAQRTLVEESARRLASGLQLVGVMALEFFVSEDGAVLFNEMAPRPHNSGHWTIEAAWPSQFTQHMRAVAGWPVVPPRWWGPAVMINLLGDLFLDGQWSRVAQVATLDGVQIHWYEKREMRPGRKVGHLTIVADSLDRALEQARMAKRLLGGEWNDGS